MTDKTTLPLNARKAYWAPDTPEIIAALQVPPEDLSREQLLLVVRELDRRFMQLWDKVSFERQHGLVDYQKIPFVMQNRECGKLSGDRLLCTGCNG